ncbi:MAG: glycogen debranching protein GlgX, partial [Planctomycetes bacterium]|nr:glycogen debranching protein GlgX [Planctomycetota bacterium]
MDGSFIPGALLVKGGVRFSLRSIHAWRVQLELFDSPEDIRASRCVDLERRGDVKEGQWSIEIPGAGVGQLYAYRVDGPWKPEEGHRYNRAKRLLDPYAKCLVGEIDWRSQSLIARAPDSEEEERRSEEDSSAAMAKCKVIKDSFDWGGDWPPRRSWSETLIYESHLGGMSRHPSSGVRLPGSYSGFGEKLKHIADMGFTAVELLPVQEFAETTVIGHGQGARVVPNYWGYNTVNWFQPHRAYAGSSDGEHAIREFKELVKAAHAMGLEIILDTVFNHSAELDSWGPTLSLRGMDDATFYIHEQGGGYHNASGCGNTLNTFAPAVCRLIVDALEHWVETFHVDGFRFDLAGAFYRGEGGRVEDQSFLVQAISESPILREVKFIAEPWDAIGLYRLGAFPGHGWSEWNDRFRDHVRSFWRGDGGFHGKLASCMAGSNDIFGIHEGLRSLNYITSHDGFTLRDLVSYEQKHNEANGEEGRDGCSDNRSRNWGCEGDCPDPSLQRLRLRVRKNLLITLLLSRGVPMFLAGDELGNTQSGNNNAWCQDSEVSWIDWSRAQGDIQEFTRLLIAFRKTFLHKHGLPLDALTWYDRDLLTPQWDRGDICHLALSARIGPDEARIFIAFNASSEVAAQRLPYPFKEHAWVIVADTGAEEIED